MHALHTTNGFVVMPSAEAILEAVFPGKTPSPTGSLPSSSSMFPFVVLSILKSDCATGLFVDGIFVKKIFKNEKIVIRRNEKPIVFLRKDGFNFYKRLSQKLKDRTVDN